MKYITWYFNVQNASTFADSHLISCLQKI